MRILHVSAFDGEQWIDNPEITTDSLKGFDCVTLSLPVNGVGRLRETRPELWKLLKGGAIVPPLEADIWAPAGKLCFAAIPTSMLTVATAQCLVKFVHVFNTNIDEIWRGYMPEFFTNYPTITLYRKSNGTSVTTLSLPFDFSTGGLADVFCGLDFTGQVFDPELSLVEYKLCSFVAAKFTGKPAGGMSGCNLMNVDFNGYHAVHKGRYCIFDRCHLYGVKNFVTLYAAGPAIEDDQAMYKVENVQPQPQNFICGKTKASGIKRGKAEGPAPSVADFLANKTEAGGSEPEPNDVMKMHLKNGWWPGCPLSGDKVWCDGVVVSKSDTCVCPITGWRIMATPGWRIMATQVRSLAPVDLRTYTALTGLSPSSSIINRYGSTDLIFVYLRGVDRFLLDRLCCCSDSAVYGLRQYGWEDRNTGDWYFNEVRQRSQLRRHDAEFDELIFQRVDNEPSEPCSGAPFFGVELEVEVGPKASSRTRNETVTEILKDPVFMTKSDGSLHDGYEIVTRPFSWGWWQANRDTKFNNLLSLLRSHGMISHDSGRAGLHVHISRNAFDQLEVQRKDGGTYRGSLHLLRFSRMIYGNPQWAIWMSRRPSANPNYAKIQLDGSFDNDALKTIVTGGSPWDRYQAVNLSNPDTVEVRMFRGTLNFKSFCYTIEFCHALWAYTRDMTAEMTVPDFASWVCKSNSGWYEGCPVLTYPYLTGLFKNKADEMASVLNGKKEFKFRDEGYSIPAEKLAKLKKLGVAVVEEN